MGSANYFASGQWNFYCDLCGAKRKSSDGVQTWNKLWVCRHHKEVRNPQDFVRGVAEDLSVPWSRPAPPDTFVPWDILQVHSEAAPLADTLGFSLLLYSGPEPGSVQAQAPVNFWAVNAAAVNAGHPILTPEADWLVPLAESFSLIIT